MKNGVGPDFGMKVEMSDYGKCAWQSVRRLPVFLVPEEGTTGIETYEIRTVRTPRGRMWAPEKG